MFKELEPADLNDRADSDRNFAFRVRFYFAKTRFVKMIAICGLVAAATFGIGAGLVAVFDAEPAHAQTGSGLDDGQNIRPYDPEFGFLVLNAGFGFVERKFVEQISMLDFTLAALRGLSVIDRSLTVFDDGAAIQLVYQGEAVGQLVKPGDNDPTAWARLTVEAVGLLRADVRRYSNANSEALFEAIFDGGTTALDSPSRYNSAAESTDLRANRRGFQGVGLILRSGIRTAQIISIVPDSPADLAGILVGDRIFSIDGERVRGWTDRRLRQALRGAADSPIELTLRLRDGVQETVTLARAPIVPPSVRLSFQNGLADIAIEIFNRGTTNSVKQILETLIANEEEPLRGVTLDLRFNPGGLLAQAAGVADLFLDGGVIATTDGRASEATSEFIASPGDLLEGLPLVVLVNARSASASEVLAVALQDRGRAVVVGSNSFGKGSVQSVYPLPNSGDLVVTWSLLRAPSGYVYNGLGVMPNVCTSGQGGVTVAGGLSLTPPDPISILAAFRAQDPQVFRSLLVSWRSVQGTEDEEDILNLRRICSPVRGDQNVDTEIAHNLILDNQLYADTLDLSGTVPVAVADLVIVAEDGTPVEIANLLSNDTDLDGDTLRVTKVNGANDLVGQSISLPSGAVITVHADGRAVLDITELNEELSATEILTERLNYIVGDGEGGESEAEITVSIEGRNDAPIAMADTFKVDEDFVLEIAAVHGLLANDLDLDSAALEIVAINGDRDLVGDLVDLASGAKLSIRADGSVMYDPASGFEALGDNDRAIDEFSYTVSDGEGGQATGTTEIVIAGANDAPIATPDEVTVPANGRISLSPFDGALANDFDVESGQISIVAVNGAASSVGTEIILETGLAIFVAADGSLSADPSGRFDEMAAGDTLVERLEYTVSDVEGAQSVTSIDFFVEGVNDAPLARGDRAETDRATVLDISMTGLLSNDFDIDGDELRVVAVNGSRLEQTGSVATELGAVLQVTPAGDLIYNPALSVQLAALSPLDMAEDSFTYTIADSSGATSVATVAIFVSGLDEAIGDQNDIVTNQNAATIIDILSRVSDPDGDRLTITNLIPTTEGIGLETDDRGRVVYDPNGQFDALAEGERGSDTFIYEVSDGRGGIAEANVLVTVIGLNDQPVAVKDRAEVMVGDQLVLTRDAGLLSNDTDIDGDALAIISVEGVEALGGPLRLPSGAELTLQTDGSLSYMPPSAQDLVGRAAGEISLDSFTYLLSDGHGGTALGTVEIMVNNPNRPPIALDIGRPDGG